MYGTVISIPKWWHVEHRMTIKWDNYSDMKVGPHNSLLILVKNGLDKLEDVL